MTTAPVHDRESRIREAMKLVRLEILPITAVVLAFCATAGEWSSKHPRKRVFFYRLFHSPDWKHRIAATGPSEELLDRQSMVTASLSLLQRFWFFFLLLGFEKVWQSRCTPQTFGRCGHNERAEGVTFHSGKCGRAAGEKCWLRYVVWLPRKSIYRIADISLFSCFFTSPVSCETIQQLEKIWPDSPLRVEVFSKIHSATSVVEQIESPEGRRAVLAKFWTQPRRRYIFSETHHGFVILTQ